MMLNKLGYLIKEGFKGIFIHSFMSFASVSIIVACLIVMGSFALLAINIDNMIDELEEDNQVIAYIDESLSEEEAETLSDAVNSIPNVREATFMSRDEAMVNYVAQYEDDSLFEDIDSSVFRHRYVVYLEDITLMEQTSLDLEEIDGIEDISAHFEIAEGFIKVRNVVSVISIVLVVMLMMVSVFIMTNTIKLATFGRREEIAIMKMVGATNSFIKLPFIVEGMVLGVLGAGIAFALQWGIYELVSNEVLTGIAGALVIVMPFTILMYPVLIVFLLIGFVVGTFGGVMAIKNYLNV